MKRLFSFLMTVALMVGFSTVASAKDTDRSHTLKIYNWADYIDEDLLDEFKDWYKEQTGEDVEIIYQLFDINEVMLTKIETGHEDYDLVCPSEYIIERMLRNKLLQPINRDFGNTPDYIPNQSPFFSNLINQFPAGNRKGSDYAVGYMWGTTGIMYNTKYVTDAEASTWGSIWDPKFNGRILMKDAFRDVYGSLMMYIRKDEIESGSITRGMVMNDFSDESLAMFEEAMVEARDNINGWEVDLGKERMIQGKDWINVTWSGDALWAMDEVGDEVSLDYRVPDEGSNVWFDGWVIPIYAKNPKAASYFINYMCMPENAIRNMDVTGYVSVIASDDILEESIDGDYSPIDLTYFFGEGADSVCVNPIKYPDAKTISRCALMHDSGDRVEAMVDMWSRVKGDSLSTSTLVIIGLVVLAIIAAVIYNRSRKKNRHGHPKRH